MTTVIPAPLQAVRTTEPGFSLAAPVQILVAEALAPMAKRFASEVVADTGLKLPVRTGAASDGLRILLDAPADDQELAGLPTALGLSPHGGEPAGERYRIDVTAGSIRIRATAEEGLFRGLTTLRQLLAQRAEVPAQHILDGPRFAWRGLSLDVARTFFSVEQVERVIDILASYKLNVLHLHLTDDTGWRLDIPGKPTLAQVGGQHAVGDRPGGWYSQDDFAALVRYAAERFVTVIPEIDLPGHATALLRSCPELTAEGIPPERVVTPGMPLAALDLGVKGTAEFVDQVLAAVAAVSPAPFLHVGGDEAFGLPDVAFERFVEHATATVRRLGKRVVGWQEISRAGVQAGDVVQYWYDRTDELAALAGANPSDTELVTLAEKFGAASEDAARAVAKGTRILLSPSRFAYLDVPYAEPSADPGQEATRQRVGAPFYPRSNVRDVLAWDPETLLAGIVPRDQLAGVEAALWCESVEDLADACFLLLPRLPGIAEKSWSHGGGPGWDEYRGRLCAHGQLWERRGWNFFRSSLVDWNTRS